MEKSNYCLFIVTNKKHSWEIRLIHKTYLRMVLWCCYVLVINIHCKHFKLFYSWNISQGPCGLHVKEKRTERKEKKTMRRWETQRGVDVSRAALKEHRWEAGLGGGGVSGLKAGILKALCGDRQQCVRKQMKCDNQLEHQAYQPVSLRLCHHVRKQWWGAAMNPPGNMSPS